MQHRARFVTCYVLLGMCALGCVVGVAVGLRGQLPSPPRSQGRDSHTCVQVGCAQVGDQAEYRLHGRVTQVSEPQPGVRCVQVSSARSAGDLCQAQ